MDIVQDFKNGIAWYQPTTDAGSWKEFYDACYSVDFQNANAEILKKVAWNSAKITSGPDQGMWEGQQQRLQIFLDSNISLSDNNPYLQEAIQYEFIACFVNNYSHAAHNADLWQSIHDSAVRVLNKQYADPGLAYSVSFNPRWLLGAIPVILYNAIKTIRISYYCPTEDTGSWDYFQNLVFDINLLDRFHFCYNSTYLMSNVTSSVDAGMWSTLRSAASAFLDANLGLTPNSTKAQIQMAIDFCNVFKVNYTHSAHNEDLWKLYNDSFANASQQLTVLLNH